MESPAPTVLTAFPWGASRDQTFSASQKSAAPSFPIERRICSAPYFSGFPYLQNRQTALERLSQSVRDPPASSSSSSRLGFARKGPVSSSRPSVGPEQSTASFTPLSFSRGSWEKSACAASPSGNRPAAARMSPRCNRSSSRHTEVIAAEVMEGPLALSSVTASPRSLTLMRVKTFPRRGIITGVSPWRRSSFSKSSPVSPAFTAMHRLSIPSRRSMTERLIPFPPG